MHIPINIDNLISQRTVESSRIEYKGDWNPEKTVRTICAFANDFDNLGGGYIIIGIEDEDGMPKRPIKGLNKGSVDRINRELLNICNLIEPRYLPIVENTTYNGKDIIVIWAPGGSQRPYKCPNRISVEKGDKSYYIRKMSNSVKANANEEKELFDLATREPFDDRINHSAEIGDLRPNLMSNYLNRVGSDMYQSSLTMPASDLAMNMRIVRGPKEDIRPLNVGLMFFNERPDDYFRCARIEVVDKPDPTGEGMVEKTFYGPLDIQLEDALRFIENYIVKERVDKRPDRPEAERTFNYPFQAIEEILSNAVYHKDYQIPEPITVTVTPESMEILSLPGPDRSITDEDLSNYHMVSSKYRNRRIGDFLKELKLTEGRNTGIPKALWALKMNGSEPIRMMTDPERSYFRVIIPVNRKFIGNTPVVKNNAKIRRKPEETREMIIDTLSEKGDMSLRDLSKSIGYTNIPRNMTTIIKQLIDEGIVEYEYPDNMNNRNQRICLK